MSRACWNSRTDLLFVCGQWACSLNCDENKVVSVVRMSSVVSEFTLFCFVFRITYMYLHFLYFVWILYHIFVHSASPILLRKSSFVPLISSYNCCSFIWTVLGLTATDHKPFLPHVLGLVLSCVASICMFIIWYPFLLFPVQFCHLSRNIRLFESHV